MTAAIDYAALAADLGRMAATTTSPEAEDLQWLLCSLHDGLIRRDSDEDRVNTCRRAAMAAQCIFARAQIEFEERQDQ